MDPATMAMLSKFILPMVTGAAKGKGGGGGGGMMGGAGGGMGGGISNILGTLMGVGQLAVGSAKKKKAEGMFPVSEDPEMRAYLNDVQRQKRSFKTGSAFAESIKELKEQQALTNRGILAASGGASGAAISGLSRTQSTTGDIYGRYVEKGIEQQNFLQQLEGHTLQGMSDRRLELQTARYNQKMAEAIDLKKKGGANLMAGFSFLTGNKNQSGAPPVGGTMPDVGSGGFNLPQNTPGQAGDVPTFDLSTLG